MHEFHGKKVGRIGFGLMGFTWRPEPCSEEQAFAAMREAIAQGCTYWDGGEFYGTPKYNSMTLLSRYFAKYPEDRDRVVLNIKGGIQPETMAVDGSPEGMRRSIDNITGQLGGPFEVFEIARRDPKAPFDVALGTINEEYIKKGRVGGIAISEVSAATIHEAAKHAKLSAIEVELSLWSTDVLTNGVAEACAKYGVPLLAYSPLGQGMLTGQIKKLEDIPKGDIRRHFARFQPDTFPINLQLVKQVEALAAKKGCTPAQLALGWVLSLQRRPGMPTIIPIPGATTAARVRENATSVELTDEEMAEIDETLAKFEVKGRRYAEGIPIET